MKEHSSLATKKDSSLVTKQDEQKPLVLVKPNRVRKPKVRTGCITCKYDFAGSPRLKRHERRY